MRKCKIFTQYSFATRGADNLEYIRSLRETLAKLEGHPLADIYAAFNLAAIPSPMQNDILDKVDVVRATTTDDLYAFFLLTTTTYDVTHTELWKGIGMSLFPHVRVDMLGSRGDNRFFCAELLVPSGIQFYPEESTYVL